MELETHIDLIHGKSVCLNMSIFIDDINELTALQERFTTRNLKGFFKYLAEKIE